MKSWKKRLFDELGEMTPRADERFMQNGSSSPKRSSKFSKGHIASAVISVLATVVAVIVLCVTLIPSGGSSGFIDKSVCLTLEINPKAIFSVDENGLVDAVVALNGDADVVLNSENSPKLLGKPVSDALSAFVEEATRLGFIDPDAQSAIRISASEDKSNSLPDIAASLEGYCRKKGSKTLVASKTLTNEEMSAKCGLTETDADLTAVIKSLSPSYATRAANTLDADELKSLYENEFVHGQIKAILSESISSLPEKLAKISSLFDEMTELNEKIREHKDNPIIFDIAKDYWSVKGLRIELTPELAALVNEMDEKTNEYTLLTGNKISSSAELTLRKSAFSKFYATVPVDLIKKLSAFMSDEDFDYYAEKLLDILDKAGDKNGAALRGLLSVDQMDYEKFSSLVSSVYEKARESRLNAFGEKFSAERAEISGEEYASLIAEVVKEYGSLDAYYESLKK